MDGFSPQEVVEYQAAIRISTQALTYLEEGRSRDDAAVLLGLSRAKLTRLLAARAEADAGNPRALVRGKSTGRPAVSACMTPEAIDFVRRKVTMCGSKALVYSVFVDDPLCPEPLREYLLDKMRSGKPLNLPLSLRRAANVTPEMKALYRGPTAYQHIAFKCRHNDMVQDPETGEMRPLMAGDLYVSDDMSSNYYFWYELDTAEQARRAGAGDKLAERWGVGIGRQGLYTMDVAGKWLGAELIARRADAYTSADVLRHFRKVLSEYGMPRIAWILEKGVWMARNIEGKRVVNFDDSARMEIVAGLSSLGFHVEHVHTSEGKIIENGFGMFQKAMDLMENAPNIGRIRGEMEREAKQIQRVRNGVVHPEKIGLPHIDDLLDYEQKALVFLNARPKHGRIQKGVPDERWHRDTQARPLRPLKPEHMGVFMPVKIETSIRQGCVEKKIQGQTFRFTNPELFARLGHGYRVLLAFDDTDPAAGAELFNLETGSRNVLELAPKAWMGHAEWEAEIPLFGYSNEVADSNTRRKRYHRAFRTAYAGTGLFGRRAVKAAEARDGRGAVAVVEQNHGRDARATEQDLTRGGCAPGSYETPPDRAIPPDTLTDRRADSGVRIKSRFDLLTEAG